MLSIEYIWPLPTSAELSITHSSTNEYGGSYSNAEICEYHLLASGDYEPTRFGRVSPSSATPPKTSSPYTITSPLDPWGSAHSFPLNLDSVLRPGERRRRGCLDPLTAGQIPHRSLATTWTREGLGLISIVLFTLRPTLLWWLPAFPVWASPNSGCMDWLTGWLNSASLTAPVSIHTYSYYGFSNVNVNVEFRMAYVSRFRGKIPKTPCSEVHAIQAPTPKRCQCLVLV